MRQPFSKLLFRSIDPQTRPRRESDKSSWKRIITVSNRLPFNIKYDSQNRPIVLPSSGGLVTALTPLVRRGASERGVTAKWVGWPGTDRDEGLEEAVRAQGFPYDIGMVKLSADEVRKYYLGYANEVLYPLFLGHTDKVDLAKAQECWPTYRIVQRKFAKKICEDLTSRDILWMHDSQVLGVAKELRTLGVSQPMGFFFHTHAPFPNFSGLEVPQRAYLVEALLAHDVIGFQTKAFLDWFVQLVQVIAPSAIAVIHGSTATISYRGVRSRLVHSPISIDASEFEEQAYTEETERNVRRLGGVRGDTKLILNAGRLDYSKGFFEELQAIDLLLQKWPALIDSFELIQHVIPSRGEIAAYREYRESICTLARELNEKYGRRIVRQIHASMGRARYLAHLRQADIQSIPSLSDGMNLIAKEYAIVGPSHGVMLLGENAGAAEEFGRHALIVDPKKTSAFAESLYKALTMDQRESRHRKSALKSIVTRHDIYDWWDLQQAFFQQVWDAQ